MHEPDRDELKARAQKILEQHQGVNNCITMYQLYNAITGEPIIPRRRLDQTRVVRSLIAELQKEGCPIVHRAAGGGGYYYATNDAELDKEANWFRKRALSSFRRERALRKISTKKLLTQYELELATEEEK